MQKDKTTQQRIEELLQIKTENYRLSGEGRPEIAAQFAIESILQTYKTQMEHIDQLMDWEIEDAIIARSQIKQQH